MRNGTRNARAKTNKVIRFQKKKTRFIILGALRNSAMFNQNYR